MSADYSEIAKALAEPARLAIEKLSAGCGRLYEPTHIRRIARANADKALIEAIGGKDAAVLLEAAEHRESYRRLRQELNLGLITDRASQLFEEGTPKEASPPADEWVDEFTDNCKDASSEELRELWARLYVAETKQSGVVPRRVLRIVRDLDASLAQSFTRFLACSITAGDGRILVLTFEGCFTGVDFTERSLCDLEDIGLVERPTWNSQIGTGIYRLSQRRFLRLTFDETKTLPALLARLTSSGIAIAAVVERSVDEQYVKNLCAAAEAAGAKVEHLIENQPIK